MLVALATAALFTLAPAVTHCGHAANAIGARMSAGPQPTERVEASSPESVALGDCSDEHAPTRRATDHCANGCGVGCAIAPLPTAGVLQWRTDPVALAFPADNGGDSAEREPATPPPRA
jgi:hypothetical protein